MISTAAVEIIRVDKSFGERFRPAVQELSLQVGRGDVLGLIGPNGAGKTTTILMLAGLLQPSAGTLRILGREVRAGRGDPRVGLVCGSLEDFDYLTGRESVILAGRLLGLTGAEAFRRTEVLLAAFDLGEAGNGMITTYSSGMRQKVRIACALIGNPSVLLLDEPFEALDPAAAMILAAIVRRFAAAGGAVLLSSHDLRHVERLATHYAILNAGRLQETARMDALAEGPDEPHRTALEERLWSLIGVPAAPEMDWLCPLSGEKADGTLGGPNDRTAAPIVNSRG